MKNLKNFAFGLLVAVLAISTQAFTSTKTEANAKFAIHYYGWDGTEYRLIGTTPQLENCVPGNEVCVKMLDTENPPQTISYQDAQTLDPAPGSEENSEFNFDN